ncbi:uncharacterized protein LOC125590197 isoform X2 [Brassica napus]|uniref:uncharacterized protein LOC125590197 isoform X2 n=1 Tax=Brassica napus TaxID=3708 RepID=UPI00207A60DF|nr:uncharacterized protein LOC125590197 isoform X2 [Brassica napus]
MSPHNNSTHHYSPKTKTMPQTSTPPSPLKTPKSKTPLTSTIKQQDTNHDQPTKDIEICSAPPRLYPVNLSPKQIASIPTRISHVRKPVPIQTPRQLGFVAHATTVNDFASQATSKTTSKTSTSDQEHSDPLLEATSALVYVSDSSPSKKLPAHVPSGPEEYIAKLLLSSPPVPATMLFAPIDPQLWEDFHNTLQHHQDILHINSYTTAFKNSSLIRLAIPGEWTDSTQMEVLIYRAGVRNDYVLAKESSIFVTPWLTSYIQKKWRQFNAAVDKNKFRWDAHLSKLVLLPGQQWISNIHTIYAPMIWDDRHWVGLAINLHLSHVEVLDPFLMLYNDRKAKTALQPVLEMLPFIISKLTTNTPSQFEGDRPFTWQRRKEI